MFVRNLELKSLQAYAAKLVMLSLSESLSEQTREGIKRELAEVRRKINLILNEGRWRI